MTYSESDRNRLLSQRRDGPSIRVLAFGLDLEISKPDDNTGTSSGEISPSRHGR